MIEGTGIEEAFGMVEGYEYGGNGSLISLGQMLREILQEVDLVGDLESAESGQRKPWVGTESVGVQ